MLDDAAFATQWVESRDRARPRGERALRQELRQKGIDSDTIARTLDQRSAAAADHDGPLDSERRSADEVAARRLLLRHAAALERVADPRARRQRAYQLLARSGFGPEIAGALAREASMDSVEDQDE